jgi:N-acetylglucosamine malate deacetylase 1
MINPYQTLKSIKNAAFALAAGALTTSIAHFRSRPFEISRQPAIVFAPHQDDETFGCGGLMALKRQLGVPVTVGFLTDGTFYQSTNDAKQVMRQMRQSEAIAALELLGVPSEQVHFLDQPDGSLQNLLASEAGEMLIERIMQLIQQYDRAEVYVPCAYDRHPDHEATYQLVKLACDRLGESYTIWQYPVWAFWQISPGFSWRLYQQKRWNYLPTKAVMGQKQAAISAHQSQMAILPKSFVRLYDQRPFEIFLAS